MAVDRPEAHALCALEEIPDGGGRAFRIPGPASRGGRAVPIFVIRRGARLYGYENSCPHVGTPLDWVPGEFLDRAGEHIICSTHGALFRVEDGYCFAGPCVADTLDPVTIEVREAVVYARFPS